MDSIFIGLRPPRKRFNLLPETPVNGPQQHRQPHRGRLLAVWDRVDRGRQGQPQDSAEKR